ncbi:MAG: hypothetical protein JJU28_18750 [Cyclobacteriaceae bacterium]|nr:hypothetical protein [Cyclobacteriaceae bacterium]
MKDFKKRSIVASIGFILLLMAFGSHGSFNPKEVGFYTAIMAGVMFYFISYHGFMYVLKRQKNDNDE